MKRIIITIITCILGTSIYAQQMYNTSLKDSTQLLVFIGTENRMEITGVDPYSSLSVLTEQGRAGEIYIVEDRVFSDIRVTVPADKMKIEVKEAYKTLYKGEFEIRKMPAPRAWFTNIATNTSVVDVNDMVAGEKLMVIWDCELKNNFYVESFVFSYNEGGVVKTLSIKGDRLSPEALDKIKSLPSGTKLFFDEIRMTDGVLIRNFSFSLSLR